MIIFVYKIVGSQISFHVQFWTESFVQWSPMGTYLATIHRQGAAVWGGAATFNRLMRYAHPQVNFGYAVFDVHYVLVT